MPVPTSKPCATCAKPCYPTEKVMVSDLWVHKHGCLKCSMCFTTLSLSSVYVAPAPGPSGEKQLYCAKDVPKTVHANVVDSLALRAALNAPNPTTIPAGVFGKVKGASRSIRFKGLTLRSRAIKAGLEAPKLDIRGMMKTRGVVGNAPGSPLGLWDIVHAMNVQSNVSSPLRDHPAIYAQRTGSSAYSATMPSQPLVPDLTGDENPAKAGKDDEPLTIEPGLVKNLIKVFQLETISSVEVDLPVDIADLQPASASSSDDPNLKALPSSSSMLDDAFFASGTFTKHTMRNTGTLRTLATIGTIAGTRFESVSSSSLHVHHAPSRAALSEIFGRGPAPPAPPTPAKVEVESDGLPTLEEGRKAMALLQALLPMAAHLIPLPGGDDGIEDHIGAEEESLAAVEHVIDTIDAEVDQAREELIKGLEGGQLELIMLFEELPEAEGVVLD